MNGKPLPFTSFSLAVVIILASVTTILAQGGGRNEPSGPRKPSGPRAAARVKVAIVSVPGNSQVYVDGRQSGETDGLGDLTVELGPGRHKVKISREGFVDQERTISVTRGGGREMFVLAPILVTLVVITEPPEAEVYVDGGYKGLSRSDGHLNAEGVKYGEHVVRAQRKGYLPQEETVKVGARTPAVQIKLEPDAVAQRIHVIDDNLSSDRLTEAFGIYGELKEAKPNHTDLPPALERILERLNNRSINTLSRLGVRGLMLRSGEAEELRDLYDLARKFKPGDSSIANFLEYWTVKYLVIKAQTAVSTPERDDALQKVRAGLGRLNSANFRIAHLLYDLGWIYLSLSERIFAARLFEQARTADYNWAPPHFALGLVEIAAADQLSNKKERKSGYERALASLNQAIILNPRLDDAYSLRAITYSGLNKDREAITNGLQAVSINPQSGYAHFALGYAYFQKGKKEYPNADREFALALGATGEPLDASTRRRVQELRAEVAKVRK